MPLRHTDEPLAPPTVPIKFVLQDPHALTGGDQHEATVRGAKGENLLEIAMRNGINIEHACGGVAACSTCHVYVNRGMERLSEPEDDELDRVEEAPGLQRNSRLSCQCVIRDEAGGSPGAEAAIEVEVPAWNRNAIKENPH